jgi:predicted kinase
MRAILTIGCSASGKTTFAEELCRKDGNWVNVNRDALRFSLFGASGWHNYKFKKDKENLITQIQEDIIHECYMAKKNVIVSDTHLNPKTRAKMVTLLNDHGFSHVEIKEFPITLEEAWKRDRFRGVYSVGQEVIYKQYKQWREYKGERVYVPNTTLPDAYICDLDGTLFDMEGVRGPFDWDKVDQDKPREEIINIIRGLYALNYKIILFSGRDGVCKELSEKALAKAQAPYDEFHIRKEGDKRKDTIVKEEMFFREVAEYYNVLGVIDDRPSVCRMWESLGLNVINVGCPWEEF